MSGLGLWSSCHGSRGEYAVLLPDILLGLLNAFNSRRSPYGLGQMNHLTHKTTLYD